MLVQEVEDHVPASTRFQLTPVESTLRNLLLDVAKHVDALGTPPELESQSQVLLPEDLAKEAIVLRFTGGWVRDKLLGVPSHDIDVAINKMTGYQFGLRMKEYLEIPGNLEKYGLESIAANEKQSAKAGTTDKSKTVGGLHKIEANPEKSKHLETTTMRILGLDIDLVNLRKETYSDDSRNPQIEFGTPEEDALRRDATVNAMFYNINEEKVEDFTGRGHEDMKHKRIRTPLEPFQTFKDDPLRVLRLIRFASRLGYTIETDALEAMGNPEIKDALRRKISRERVGTEVEKSLQGPNPHEAMRLIFSLNLYDTIFSDPALANVEHYTPDTGAWQTLIDSLRDFVDNGGVIAETLARDREEQYLAWQLAAMVPYRDAPVPEPTEPGRKPPPAIAVQVAREGIKATNKICDVISSSLRNQAEISDLVDKLQQKKRRPDKKVEGQDPAARDTLGMAIRRWGASWRSQVMYSLLVEIANDREQIEGESEHAFFYKYYANERLGIERRYTAFLDHIRELNLTEAHTFKPLMDGKQLAKAIGASPGPWMKDALDVVMAWQLRNPDSTDPQNAIEEVKDHQAHGELTSDLIRHFLKLTIRPLFVKSSPATVTEQGRKVTTERLPEKLTMRSADEAEMKPWKNSKNTYSLDILQWAVHGLDHKIVSHVWPLVIPPLLTLVDDWEATCKRMGAELINTLLKTTPPSLLERTGLGEVFEEALMPCLTFLPPITPESDSVSLLSTTYPTLLTLARVRFPKDLSRTKFLDTVVRKGILHAYTYCPHHPPILTALFDALTLYLPELGIASVKHLQYILPPLTTTLSHPLSTASLPMLSSAITALQALLQNCWPRIPKYRGEVLKGVTLCWLQIASSAETPPDAADGLRRQLRDTVALLSLILRDSPACDVEAECRALVDAEPRLQPLFDP